MNCYDSDLQRLQQKIMEKKRLDAKYADLLEQQKELEERTAELEKIMLDEQEDVDRLTGFPAGRKRSFPKKRRRPGLLP